MPTKITGRCLPVVVEYDSRGERVRRLFTEAYKAKQFYLSKLRAGRNPQVKKEN